MLQIVAPYDLIAAAFAGPKTKRGPLPTAVPAHPRAELTVISRRSKSNFVGWKWPFMWDWADDSLPASQIHDGYLLLDFHQDGLYIIERFVRVRDRRPY